MSQIQAAAAAALPQQAIREIRSPASTSNAGVNPATLTEIEKLEQSTKSGDRDAQEQYLGSESKDAKPDNTKTDPAALPGSSAVTIWNLSVTDDQPPSDLDIVG